MFSFQGTFELPKKFNEVSSFNGTSVNFLWWRLPGSNRWPPACKAGALPAELTPHIRFLKWWAKDSLFCGKATAVATVHRTVAKSRLSSPFWYETYGTQSPRSWLLFELYWKWWAKMDSNHRPHDYQSCALASWAIGPYWTSSLLRYIFRCTL